MKPRKKRRWIIWTSLILVVVIVFVIVVVNRTKKALKTMMPTYRQEQATTGDLDLTVYGSGSLEASDEATMPAPMPGSIAEWYYETGDEVHEGDILGVMDTEECDDQIDALKTKIEELTDAIENSEGQLDSSVAYSSINGVVKEVYVQAGSDISRVNQVYGCFMLIAPDATMTISFTPSDGYAGNVGDYVCVCPAGYDPVMARVIEVNGGTSTAEFDSYIPSGVSATIENSTRKEEIGSGTVKAKDGVTITGNDQVKAVYVQVGQNITKGQELLKYESDASGSITDKQKDLKEARADLADLEAASPEIVSTTDGILTSINAGTLTMGYTAAGVSPLDAMDLVVSIDELDIGEIQQGQTASISIDALPDTTYTGTVTRISQVGSASGGVTTYDVTLTINETADLRLGMNASAEILVDKREGIVILPLEAIQYQGDRPYVLLADGGAQTGDSEARGTDADTSDGKNSADMTDEERQAMAAGSLENGGGTVQFVEVGLMNERYAEIVSGLEAGDTVLVPASSSMMDLSNMGMSGGPVVVTEEIVTSESDSRSGRWE